MLLNNFYFWTLGIVFTVKKTSSSWNCLAALQFFFLPSESFLFSLNRSLTSRFSHTENICVAVAEVKYWSGRFRALSRKRNRKLRYRLGGQFRSLHTVSTAIITSRTQLESSGVCQSSQITAAHRVTQITSHLWIRDVRCLSPHVTVGHTEGPFSSTVMSSRHMTSRGSAATCQMIGDWLHPYAGRHPCVALGFFRGKGLRTGEGMCVCVCVFWVGVAVSLLLQEGQVVLL